MVLQLNTVRAFSRPYVKVGFKKKYGKVEFKTYILVKNENTKSVKLFLTILNLETSNL